MIHILTVHWKDDRWVDIQLKYFKENITDDYQVYAFLNDLPRDHQEKFFYSSTEYIKSHAIKLNLLADMAIFNSRNDDDLLLFIDGDAFPIGDVVTFANNNLNEYPLIAVQRSENFGDMQPHPCFCMTTVKFWKEIKGDWKAGYQWQDSAGEYITDVGGNLLGLLNENNIEWLPMLRSNKKDLHKLWFGIYGDLVYHHGAGFRRPFSRLDSHEHSLFKKYNLFQKLRSKTVKSKNTRKKSVINENILLSEKVFQSILDDRYFYRFFHGE